MADRNLVVIYSVNNTVERKQFNIVDKWNIDSIDGLVIIWIDNKLIMAHNRMYFINCYEL